MAKHRKVFRFRMEPKPDQEQALARMAGARRFIWNWGLARWKAHYQATGKSIALKQLSAELTALKQQPETAWLNEVDSQALQHALKDLHQAFTNFFKKRAKHPRFKSRRTDRARFRIPQRVTVEGEQVYVPKIGWVKIRLSQPIDGQTKSATFRREADGHWYVSLTVEFEMPSVALPAADPAQVVGIDLGLIDFATLSDDSDPIPAPKFYRQGQRKLRAAQKTVSRRKKGSNRKQKAQNKLARVHLKIGRQRRDFLHKLTTGLVHAFDGLCIEDLPISGLVKTKLAKSFSDAAMGEFRRQLTYKCQWNRKHLVPIDRFFPSSKMCSQCGALNHELTLSDREWDCPVCGAHHHRDRNAAYNLRDEGLRILAVGQTESQNAQGDTVRPGIRAGVVELRIPRL